MFRCPEERVSPWSAGLTAEDGAGDAGGAFRVAGRFPSDGAALGTAAARPRRVWVPGVRAREERR